jgi:hypothetical protein
MVINIKTLRNCLIVATVFVMCAILTDQGIFAVEPVAKTVKGLTVSPLRTELSVDPGTSQDSTLTLTNSNDHPITVTLTTEEFSVIDQQYDYAFNAATQLTKWVTFTPDTLDLAPGQTKTATFRVGVPLGAEPGGRYLSMFATTDAGTPVDGVVSQQRIASLIYLTVNGDVSRSGHLISFAAPWFVTGTTDWTANLQNTGTTHYHSRYNVVVQPLIGNQVVASSTSSSLVLPGTIRNVTGSIPLPNFPGIYKVTYTIGLGDTPAVVETRYIVYFPPVAIITSIFGVVLLASIVSEYRSRKKKNKSNSSEGRQYK